MGRIFETESAGTIVPSTTVPFVFLLSRAFLMITLIPCYWCSWIPTNSFHVFVKVQRPLGPCRFGWIRSHRFSETHRFSPGTVRPHRWTPSRGRQMVHSKHVKPPNFWDPTSALSTLKPLYLFAMTFVCCISCCCCSCCCCLLLLLWSQEMDDKTWPVAPGVLLLAK